MSKFDGFGREVVAADWAALADIPITVSTLGLSTPGGAGANVWTDLGNGAWGPPPPSEGSSIVGYVASDVGSINSSYVTVVASMPVQENTPYEILVNQNWVMSGGGGSPTFSCELVSDQAGTITQLNPGLGLIVNSSIALAQQYNNPVSAATQNLYASIAQAVLLRGTFSTDNVTTSVTFKILVSAGTLTVKKGSFCRLLRLV